MQMGTDDPLLPETVAIVKKSDHQEKGGMSGNYQEGLNVQVTNVRKGKHEEAKGDQNQIRSNNKELGAILTLVAVEVRKGGGQKENQINRKRKSWMEKIYIGQVMEGKMFMKDLYKWVYKMEAEVNEADCSQRKGSTALGKSEEQSSVGGGKAGRGGPVGQ